jgi:hypothetical protein
MNYGSLNSRRDQPEIHLDRRGRTSTGLAFMKTFTPYVSVDTAHTYLHAAVSNPTAWHR